MRASIDPNDPAYIDDRPRRVWLNDAEIPDWSVADEFRRCVIRKDGKVLNGSVLIERLPADKAEAPAPAPSAAPISTGFSGVFVPDTPAATPAPSPTATPAPPAAPHPARAGQGKIHKKRR